MRQIGLRQKLAPKSRQRHPRDWRPQLLASSDDSHRREQLLRFASWIEGGSGLTTAVRILEGEGVKMLKLREEAQEALRKDLIDVWWWGDATSRLMLLLAYLMTRNESWSEATIRLLATDDGSEEVQTREGIMQILNEARIEAEAEIVSDADANVVAERSEDAAVVFRQKKLLHHGLSLNCQKDWKGCPAFFSPRSFDERHR